MNPFATVNDWRVRLVQHCGSRFVHLVHRFWASRIRIHPSVQFFGMPVLKANRGGHLVVGEGCVFRSRLKDNMAGVHRPCSILVRPGARVEIGCHSGFSGVAIYATRDIRIGNHVTIGANVSIWDTDFHELGAVDRRTGPNPDKVACSPVVIEDDVFLGAGSTILKGVTIGAGAVVGACSVVTRSIPSAEVWAGNPARRIRGS